MYTKCPVCNKVIIAEYYYSDKSYSQCFCPKCGRIYLPIRFDPIDLYSNTISHQELCDHISHSNNYEPAVIKTISGYKCTLCGKCIDLEEYRTVIQKARDFKRDCYTEISDS